MRWIFCAFAAAFCSSGAVQAQATDPGTEAKKVEGRWFVAHRYYTPSKGTATVGQLLTDLGHEVEIADGKLSACDPKSGGRHLLIDFDPSMKPKAVDLRLPGKKNQVLLGIYLLENDILSLAVGTGDVRPSTFRDGEKQVLLILKRAPKKASAPGGPPSR